MPPIILRCGGNVFIELLPSNGREIHRQTQRHTRPTILLLLRVVFVAGTRLPSRCLATIGRIHTKAHRLVGGIYEVRRSDGLKYHDINTMCHKDWLRHSEVNGVGIYRHTDKRRACRSHKLTFTFSKYVK
jgi:hypothetical protein